MMRESEDKSKKEQKEVPSNPFSEGMFVVIDKPYGRTSFDVVYKFRNQLSRALNVRKMKVGHAGTLDPLATGVVVVCTGKFTKRIEEVQMQEKVYHATLKLGETTPSYDLEKEIDATYPIDHITEDMVREVLRRFEGEIEQVPPMFSAVKVDGKRAYHIARKGEEVVLTPKSIKIHEIELIEYAMPYIKIKVTCGKGTYIRSLARDIGAALQSGAHLTELRRTRVGDFRVEDAIQVEEMGDYISKILEQSIN